MSDEIFRPQRPNANPNSNPNEGVDLPQNHPLNQQQSVPAAPNNNAGPKPVQITGQAPEEFLRRMQQRKTQGQDSNSPPGAPKAPSRPQIPANSSVDLQNILQSLQSQSSIFEEITLPSLGRFYDGTDGPTDGKLHVRPMTGEEESILATPRFVKKGQAINMIFSRCIQETYRPENLLSVDRTYLLIYLRGISYGNEYEVEVKDPDSDRKFSTVIDLNSLPVDFCPLEFGPLLTDVLPKSNLEFTYRLSRGKDEQELQDHRERRLKQFGDSGADDTLLYRTAQLTDSIANITDKNELQILLKNLPIQDLSYLRGIVNEPPFGVDTKVSILSPLSSEEFEVELPLEANFFFPRRKKKDRNLA
jgi:hypothetical protein